MMRKGHVVPLGSGFGRSITVGYGWCARVRGADSMALAATHQMAWDGSDRAAADPEKSLALAPEGPDTDDFTVFASGGMWLSTGTDKRVWFVIPRRLDEAGFRPGTRVVVVGLARPCAAQRVPMESQGGIPST